MSGSPIDNPGRLAALERSGLMDSPPEDAFDALVELARDVLGGTAALVSLVDERRQFFKAQTGLGEPWARARQTPLTHSFCQHVVNESGPFLVENARTDARVKDSRAIDELGVIAYAGVPLVDEDAHALGALCVIDSQPRQWTPKEVRTLKTLAKAVMAEVHLRQALVRQQQEARERELLLQSLHDTQNALRRALERTRQVVEAVGGGLWELDIATGTVETDARTQELALDSGLVAAASAAALRGEDGGRCHLEFRTGGGSGGPVRWVESWAQALFDVGGKATHLVGVNLDITSRKSAEAEREELARQVLASEAQLRLVVDALPVLVSFVTADERYGVVNKAYEEWFGITEAQMRGQKVREVIGEAAYAVLGPHVRRGLAGETFSFEQHAVPYRLGGTRDVKVSFVSHRGTDGRVEGYVAMLQDITPLRRLAREREEALATAREAQARAEAEQGRLEDLSHRLAEREQLLRLVVESAGLSAWSMDCRTRLITADTRFLDLYGLDPAAPVPLSAVLERMHPEDRPGTERAIEAALAGQNEGRYLSERRIQGPSGTYHWGETRAQVAFAPDGTALTMRGVSFDVTLRKEAETLREQALQHIRAESERQRLMFEQAPANIALLGGPEHRFRLANARYLQLVGGREVLGLSVAEALPEVVEQGFITLLDTVRRTGEPYVGRETWLQIQQRPGAPLEDVCLDFVYQPIRDASGQVDTVFVHAVEVTALVRSREVARRAVRELEALADTLRTSEERLDLALDVAGAGTWEVDLSTQEVIADRRFRELFGLMPEEPFSLEKGLAIIHPEDRTRVAAAMADAIAGNQRGAYEADYRTVPRADGSYRWVAARGQTFFSPRGEARRFIGTGMDISARKSAELAQTRLLYSIADQGVFGVAVLEGPELRFTLANEGYRRICGDREVLGKPMLEALPELVGQGLDTLMREVLRTGKPVAASEARFLIDAHGTGIPEERFYTLTWQAIRSSEGVPTAVLVLARDITEGVRARTDLEVTAERLHRSETRLALALEMSGTGTWQMDLETGLFTMDARFREMIGHPHDEPVTFETGLVFVHPEEQARVAQSVADALAGKNAGAYAAEYRTVRQADGGYRWVSARGQVFFGPDGKAVHLAGTGLDITGIMRAREHAEAIAQQERTRAEFAQQLIGIVSHDLRNPLGAIRLGAATLQLREVLDPRTTRTLARIQSATDRAERMVRDLLDFTQVRLAGGLKIERQPADLHELVRGVVQEVEEAQPGVRIQHEARGAGQGAWDADRLQQVVQNLVTNALKYGTPGERVSVFTEGHEDTVTLGVHNPGEPIPEERQASIFQPMQRGVEGVDRQGRSVGLGLFIVRAIVEVHGGTIELTSRAEEGTTFRIVLPREAVAAQAPPAIPP